MTSMPELCDICHEPITPFGGAAVTVKTEPTGESAVCSPDFRSTDFIILCRKNYHTEDDFIIAGYLPPEWVRSLLDLQGTGYSQANDLAYGRPGEDQALD